MPHRIGFYQRGYNQIEKLLYGTTGTLQGISSSTAARDLQDYYIRKPKVRFQKPGFNLSRWQRYYENRYNPYKRRVKGDVVVETSNTQQEALLAEEPYYRDSVNSRQLLNRIRGKRYYSKQRFRSRRRKRNKGCICRNVGKRTRYKSRKRFNYSG